MVTFTPLATTLIGTLGLAILVLFALPGRQRLRLFPPERRKSVVERFQNALYAAGIAETAPSMLFVVLLIVSVTLGLLFGLLLGSVFALLLGPLVVFLVAYFYITGRQRRFLAQASDELVPFLNRIATSVVSGKPAQQAYLDAVEDSKFLKEVLEDSAAKISSGERFSLALLETLPLLPLRMWAVFVRQLELYEEVGGDVATAIERSVAQVNTMLQLQAEARADYALQSWQQRIIILMISVATGLWMLSDPGRFFGMFNSPMGFVGAVLGIGLLIFGVWFLRKQLQDVERKLSF